MVSSKARKTISFAISLLVVVISLTSVASAASAPTVTTQARYSLGFAGSSSKLAADAAGNLYATDFWGKGIVKLDRSGNRIGFIPTLGRPTAVAVKPDGRLVVAMSSPQKYVALYSQAGDELAPPFTPQTYVRPASITIDAAGNIYVLDAGDINGTTAEKVPTVRVYGPEGAFLHSFGTKTLGSSTPTAGVGGQFKLPLGIAYEKKNNQIVVADSGNQRVQFFNAYNGTDCAYVRMFGIPAGNYNGTTTNPGATVMFGDPVDIAFEYTNAGLLDRMYVADRARNEISVLDPAAPSTLALIRKASVAGSNLKLPSGLVFQKANTANSAALLYVASAPLSAGVAEAVAFGIDSGTVATPAFSLAITSTVPPTTTSSSLLVSGTVSPVYAVNCTVNGGIDNLATPSGNNWSVTLGLDTGYNHIVCRATDGTKTSYVNAAIYSTAALNQGPGVSIVSPLAGVYTNNASILVSGTTNDANASIKLTNAKNGATASTVSGSSKQWSATIALGEGANDITVEAWKPGTAVSTANVTVTADYTPPNLGSMISFLANGAKTVSAVQNLDGVVIEKNLNSITVNGEPVAATVALPTADNIYYSVPVTLVRGSNEVTVVATDRAGNSATLTRTVTLNPEIAGLSVALPAANSYLAGAGTVSANGTVDATYTSVDACGTPATLGAGTWSAAAMAINAGFNPCQFIATDGVNSVSEKRTVISDAAYANLAITSPAADLATNNPSVILSGTVDSCTVPPTISINGAAAVPVTSCVAGAFSHTVNLGLDGTTTTVKVMADGATAAIRNIMYDSTAPTLAIQANSAVAPTAISGAIEPTAKLAGITARISGADTPLPISIVTFDAYNQSTAAAVWHANLTGYSYESIKFTTVDPAGNQTQRIFVNGIPTGDVDLDGKVRLSDAMATLRHVAGTEALSGSELDKNTPRFQADVGGLIAERAAQDGIVTVEDAMLILLKAYGLKTF